MDQITLKKEGALVFDFDGTLCQLFINYDRNKLLFALHERMKFYDIEFSIEKDSFDVFSEIIRQTDSESAKREKALFDADQILTAAEIEAVNSGNPVNGVEAAFSIFARKNIPVGIATNNATGCVEAFLNKCSLNTRIPMAGRVGVKPDFMKPNPWSILEVLSKLKCKPEDTIFVGDTKRDYLASVKAGCDFIGMAPTEKKRKRLLEILPEKRIVSDFNELMSFFQFYFQG